MLDEDESERRSELFKRSIQRWNKDLALQQIQNTPKLSWKQKRRLTKQIEEIDQIARLTEIAMRECQLTACEAAQIVFEKVGDAYQRLEKARSHRRLTPEKEFEHKVLTQAFVGRVVEKVEDSNVTVLGELYKLLGGSEYPLLTE